ncbi:Mitochondrial tRNAs modification protein [Dimargaris xerosporica]|nr:Mitochondrial tRNAs modification protein [Dimargaris xerosporica]
MVYRIASRTLLCHSKRHYKQIQNALYEAIVRIQSVPSTSPEDDAHKQNFGFSAHFRKFMLKEAHALTARLCFSREQLPFPFLCLLISRGHTLLVIVHDVNEYGQLGSTTDDSVGDAFDTVARTASPSSAIDAAKPLCSVTATIKVDPYTQRFPKSLPPLAALFTADLVAAFREAVLKHLLRHLQLAMAHCTDHQVGPTALVVNRGVASNWYLRANLTQWVTDRYQLQVLCPPPQLCTDSGVIVAGAGIERMAKGCLDDYGIQIVSRWPLEALRHWCQGKVDQVNNVAG